jgi:drug/metabolite transporter (DMT)-like permease
MPFIGEFCALGTALLWSLSAIAWSHAGKRVGSQATSAVRLVIAAVLIFLIHWVCYGSPLPTSGDRNGLILLMISGLLGIGIGDLCFFQALKLVGPRIGMLLATISPAITALLAYFLPPHESLSLAAIGGMILIMFGLGWVILEEPGETAWQATPKQFRRGILLGFLGAAFFSVGYLFSRQVLDPDSHSGWEPFPATMIRVFPAMAMNLLLLPLFGTLPNVRKACTDWLTLKILIAGTVVGPVLGIWLSMIAFQKSEAGVATALINTGPLFMIPLAHLSHGERPTWRSVLGTVIAIAGVTLLVLRGTPG